MGLASRWPRKPHGRFTLDHETVSPADAWVVAGPPGSGKTTVADILLASLEPPPALLDKDTMYGSFVAATLRAAGRPLGEREGSWYDDNVKVHEYRGMTAVAREIRSKGCPAVLSAPFTTHIADALLWDSWADELGGATVRLIWVQSDAATLRHRLKTRASERDSEKLARFEEFIVSMRLDTEPVVAHSTIDNRLCARTTLQAQVTGMLAAANVPAKHLGSEQGGLSR